MAFKPIAITSTSGAQLRLAYDATHYTNLTTNSGGDLTIAPTGGDTTVTGTLTISSTLTVTGAGTFSSTLTAANNFGVAATKKLYLDGVPLTGDTYIYESSANVIDIYAGAANIIKLGSALVTVLSGADLKLGVAAAAAIAVASTHKLKIIDSAGATYYLLATT